MTMIIYTDVVSKQSFGENGNSFRTPEPSHAFGARDEIRWQLCRQTESPDPSDWTPVTLASSVGAIIACDDDYQHFAKAKITSEVPAGSLTTITVTTTEVLSEMATSGSIIIGADAYQYNSVAAGTGSLIYTMTTGQTIDAAIPTATDVDIPYGYYYSAAYSVAKSTPATGLFVFDIVVDSPKLRAAMQYADLSVLSTVAGLELLLFTGDYSAGTAVETTRYLIDTYRITGGIINLSTEPYIPDAAAVPFVAMIQALVEAGVETITPSIVDGEWYIGGVPTGVPATGGDGGGGAELSDEAPTVLGTASAGTAATASRSDHVHPTTGLVLASEKGAVNGVATLGADGKLTASQLPDIQAEGGITINAIGSLAERTIYDSSAVGFTYLATDVLYDADNRPYNLLYIRTSTTQGEWSDGAIHYTGKTGIQGQPGATGATGQAGPRGADATVIPDLEFAEEDIIADVTYGGSLTIDGIKSIAQVEVYDSDGNGTSIERSDNISTGSCMIKVLYDLEKTVVYFGDRDLTHGGKVRFASGSNANSLNVSLASIAQANHRLPIYRPASNETTGLRVEYSLDEAFTTSYKVVDTSIEADRALIRVLTEVDEIDTFALVTTATFDNTYDGKLFIVDMSALSVPAFIRVSWYYGDPVTYPWSYGFFPTSAPIGTALASDSTLSDDNPQALGSVAPGTAATASRSDHVHPTTGLVLASEKGAVNGVASLGSDGKVPAEQLSTGLTEAQIVAITKKQAIIFG